MKDLIATLKAEWRIPENKPPEMEAAAHLLEKYQELIDILDEQLVISLQTTFNPNDPKPQILALLQYHYDTGAYFAKEQT